MLYTRSRSIRCPQAHGPAVAVHVGVHPDHLAALADTAPPEVTVTTDHDDWHRWGEPPATTDDPIMVTAHAPTEDDARNVIAAWMHATVTHGVRLAPSPVDTLPDDIRPYFFDVSDPKDYSELVRPSWLAQTVDVAPSVLLLGEPTALLLGDPAGSPWLSVIRTGQGVTG